MTDLIPPPSISELLIQLGNRQDQGFAALRAQQDKLVETMQRIDKDVALVQSTMGSLKDLPAKVAHLETCAEVNRREIAELDRRVSANTTNIGTLLNDNSTRKGIDVPVGKVVQALLTAAAAALVAFLVARPTRAATPEPVKPQPIADNRCYAAPAKTLPPKFLLL